MATITYNIIDLYLGIKDFRDYVDRYAAQYNEGRSITVEEALEHRAVHEYAVWLIERSKNGK